jgi:hypothetical protein
MSVIWDEFAPPRRRRVCLRPTVTGDVPLTDEDLWQYIKYDAGGLRRRRKFWDHHLTWRENRAAFRYLDRGWSVGRPMDCLAEEIGSMWPWYGISDEDDLWEWMQRTRRC